MMSDYFQLPRRFQIKSSNGKIYTVRDISSPDADLSDYRTDEGYHVNLHRDSTFGVLDSGNGNTREIQCTLIDPNQNDM